MAQTQAPQVSSSPVGHVLGFSLLAFSWSRATQRISSSAVRGVVERQQPPSSRLPSPPTRSSRSAAPRSAHQPPAARRSKPAAAHPRRAARSSRRGSMRRRPARLDAPPPAGLRARCTAPPSSMRRQKREASYAQNEKGENFPPSRTQQRIFWDKLKNRPGSNGTGRFTGFVKNGQFKRFLAVQLHKRSFK